MSDAGTASPTPPRRWRRRLFVLGALLAALSLLATWLLQPKQLVPLILDRAGKALSLQITASPDAEARLRGTPQLVVHDLVVREPGGDGVLLRAKRVLLALPWSSVRGGGKDVVIRRIELDAPELDLAAMRVWLAKRPPSEETAIPTLTDGLRITDARLVDDTLRIEDLAIDLPSLHPQRRTAHRLPTLVVEDDGQDRQILFRRDVMGGNRHVEHVGAVTMNADHQLIGIGELDAERHTHAVAEAR